MGFVHRDHGLLRSIDAALGDHLRCGADERKKRHDRNLLVAGSTGRTYDASFPRSPRLSRPGLEPYGILAFGARGWMRDERCRTSSRTAAREDTLKEKIHPKWFEATVVCSCGNTFKTGSTRDKLHVEICSACHPFFTGNQKFVDTEGRVEKFMTKYGTVTSKKSKKAKAKADQDAKQAEQAAAEHVAAPTA